MYLNKFRFENAGPIDFLVMDVSADDGKAPKPLVFVGKNGTGKSIILSQIVSAMINAHSVAYEDSDMESGKVYKIRSPAYIRHGQSYSLVQLEFSDELFEHELVMNISKGEYESKYGCVPLHKHWSNVDNDSKSDISSNFDSQVYKVRAALSGPHLYFPPNRFEDPAWMNELSLINKVDYFSAKNFESHSNRQIIQYCPMKLNQSWLLDVVYDSFAIERRFERLPSEERPGIPIGLLTTSGPATKIRSFIDEYILKLLGGRPPITWTLGMRSRRTIGIIGGGEPIANNLLALSTGQAVLLDLFLTILRHADLSGQRIDSLEDIGGLVVIDEVDLHLHADLQHEFLPHLIKLFPNIQFVLSSHSPLFLLGMEKLFGEDGVVIVDLPSGERISAERFAEFESAYQHFANTRRFEHEINTKISQASQPMLIVEGTIDIDYIRKAAQHLDEVDLLSRFEIIDGDGAKGLDKIWKNLHFGKWNSINQTVILLYDCDVKEKNNEVAKAFQRTVPLQDSKIKSGIENMFTSETIERAEKCRPAFIDYVGATSGTKRGERYHTPELWSVNQDEKRNLCNWLCENGTKEDFERFKIIFQTIRSCIS